jgi:hypothetical protein
MKTGNARTMTDLIEDVQREATLKNDFITPVTDVSDGGELVSRVTAVSDGGNPRLAFKMNKGSHETTTFKLSKVAHEQLNALCKIGSYYKRLLELPSKRLWADNVNEWLPTVSDRTIRTFDRDVDDTDFGSAGTVRCLMSTYYRTLDNADLLSALLPQFEKRGLSVLTCNLGERQMIIKAVSPKMVAEVPRVGDTIQAGIAVGNSEVGCGSLWITELDYFLSCTNGMSGVKESKWVHRSGKSGDEDTQFNDYTEDTQRKTNEAFWAQVTDDIDRVFDEERFAVRLSNYGDATDDEIDRGDERGVISAVCSNYGIPKDDVEEVLRHYHRGGAENRFGVAAAVTRYAQDVSDYDFSTQLEGAGRKIIDGAILA